MQRAIDLIVQGKVPDLEEDCPEELSQLVDLVPEDEPEGASIVQVRCTHKDRSLPGSCLCFLHSGRLSPSAFARTKQNDSQGSCLLADTAWPFFVRLSCPLPMRSDIVKYFEEHAGPAAEEQEQEQEQEQEPSEQNAAEIPDQVSTSSEEPRPQPVLLDWTAPMAGVAGDLNGVVRALQQQYEQPQQASPL